MPKCKAPGCNKQTRYQDTKEIYCDMHRARIRRSGHLGLKDKTFHPLQKLPHEFVDDFILKNCSDMIDAEIAYYLRREGYRGATVWTVKYRRRKLGVKKYLSGEVLKHKAWIRQQAIKKYGDKCELCGFALRVETHHIVPKHRGGAHSQKNLMVLCPNCHYLVTYDKQYKLESRKDIGELRRRIRKALKRTYSYLG